MSSSFTPSDLFSTFLNYFPSRWFFRWISRGATSGLSSKKSSKTSKPKWLSVAWSQTWMWSRQTYQYSSSFISNRPWKTFHCLSVCICSNCLPSGMELTRKLPLLFPKGGAVFFRVKSLSWNFLVLRESGAIAVVDTLIQDYGDERMFSSVVIELKNSFSSCAQRVCKKLEHGPHPFTFFVGDPLTLGAPNAHIILQTNFDFIICWIENVGHFKNRFLQISLHQRGSVQTLSVVL